MSGCNFHPRLDAFFDGEMNATEHAAFRQHLQACAECPAGLVEMERISHVFSEMRDDAAEKVEAGETARLHQAVDREMNRLAFQVDRSFWRTAGLVAGLAASVLIVASAWLTETPAPHTAIVSPGNVQPDWETVAVGGPVYPLPYLGVDAYPEHSALADAHSKMTDWMIDSLKGQEGR